MISLCRSSLKNLKNLEFGIREIMWWYAHNFSKNKIPDYFCNQILQKMFLQVVSYSPDPSTNSETFWQKKKVCKSGWFLYYCVFFVITNLIGQILFYFLICNWIRCKIFVSRKTRFSNKCVTKLPWSVTNGFCIGFAAALLKSITKPTLFLPQSITKCKTKQRP